MSTHRFRTRSLVLEAEQFLPDMKPWPKGVRERWASCTFSAYDDHECNDRLLGYEMQTLEGVAAVLPGAWIITGIKGERYPCAPDIFAATYLAEDSLLDRDAEVERRRADALATERDSAVAHAESARLDCESALARAEKAEQALALATTLRPLYEWHEGYGNVLWWTLPIVEPPHIGSPLDDEPSLPDHVTHWTPILAPKDPKNE